MLPRNKTGERRVRKLRPITAVLTVFAALASGGCEDYLDRRDAVTLGAGDAIAVNKATQTINRWPRVAQQDRWLSDGERARMAVHRYRTGTVKDPKSLNAKNTSAEPEATGDQAATATTGK